MNLKGKILCVYRSKSITEKVTIVIQGDCNEEGFLKNLYEDYYNGLDYELYCKYIN